MRFLPEILLTVVGVILLVVGGIVFSEDLPLGVFVLLSGLVVTTLSEFRRILQMRDRAVFDNVIARSLKSGEPTNLYLEMARSVPPKARRRMSLLREALQIEPDSLEALKALSLSQVQSLIQEVNLRPGEPPERMRKRIGATRGIIVAALAEAPTNPGLLEAQGILLDLAGDHKGAQDCFRRLEGLIDGPHWRLPLSVSLTKVGRREEALEEIIKAKEGGLAGPLVELYLGRALHAVGDCDAALSHFQAALVMAGPDHVLLRAFRDATASCGMFLDAGFWMVRYGLSILSRRPLTGLAEIIRGINAEIFGSIILGSKRLWRLLKRLPIGRKFFAFFLFPDQPEAILGRLALTEGRLQLAEKLFSEAVRQTPWKARTRNSFGVVLLRLGRVSEARREFEKALEIEPENKLVLWNLSQMDDPDLGSKMRVVFEDGSPLPWEPQNK